MLKVYIANLSLVNDKMVKSLTEDEIAKANRYKQDDDSKRSILSSYLLKCVLQDNLINNTNIFSNDYGKPYLESKEVFFNISHSGNYVVCALSKDEVGIDIEEIRTTNDLVVKKCFTEDECQYVIDDITFTKVWTLKESYIKNIGTGLKTKLNSFSVIQKGEIVKVNNLMFTSIKLDNYYLSICHAPSKQFKMIYLNHPL